MAITPVHAKHRPIFIKELLHETEELAEVVILDYTLTFDTLFHAEPLQVHRRIKSIRYTYIHQPDSILSYTAPKTCKYGWQFYGHQDSTSTKNQHHQGFWPSVNDTVLVFFDQEGVISLMGRKTKQNNFQLWSPYQNLSGITIFFGIAPFQQDNSAQINDRFLQILQNRAEKEGYEFASVFYLNIAIEELEKLILVHRKP
ncbi:hypothetical protein [Lishizhenia tianjinensis]|nr:hypothetical protein [Lishizhenia tianjinensis]